MEDVVGVHFLRMKQKPPDQNLAKHSGPWVTCAGLRPRASGFCVFPLIRCIYYWLLKDCILPGSLLTKLCLAKCLSKIVPNLSQTSIYWGGWVRWEGHKFKDSPKQFNEICLEALGGLQRVSGRMLVHTWRPQFQSPATKAKHWSYSC